MKPPILASCFLFVFACSEKNPQKSTPLTQFSFTISDTIFVDPGDEILYLQSELHGAHWSDDGSYLYNFNRHDNALEIIDLDHFKLDKKIHFEKEGPHGTGRVQSLFYAGDGNIAVSEFHQIGLFDIHASKLATFKIRSNVFKKDTLLPNEAMDVTGVLDENGQHYISYYTTGFGNPVGIAKLHLIENALTKTPIPALADWSKHRLEWSDNGGSSAAYPSIHLHQINSKVLLSNEAKNELFVYDPTNEGIAHLTFHSELMPDSRSPLSTTSVHSEEEFEEVLKEFSHQVRFMHFTYDKANKRYYRFSQFVVNAGAENVAFKPLLTVFDQNFKQLYETTELPIEKIYTSYFAKAGKLYLYENIMDEMAFIVLNVEEENPQARRLSNYLNLRVDLT